MSGRELAEQRLPFVARMNEWWFSKTLTCYNEQLRGETRGSVSIDMEIFNCGNGPHTRTRLGGEWLGRGAQREVPSFLLRMANVSSSHAAHYAQWSERRLAFRMVTMTTVAVSGWRG